MNARKKFDPMLMLSVGMVAAIFALDLLTPLGWADGFLYLIPLILILFRSPQRRYLIGFAALCSGLIVLGWLFSPPGGAVEPVTYNRTMGIALLWVTALFLTHRKQVEEALYLSQEALERQVKERTDEFRLAIEKLKQEIADRKRVEAALRESERRLQLIMEHASDAILFLDMNGVVRWASQQTVAITGRGLNELMGQPIMMILAPGSATVVEARLAAVRRGEFVPPIVETEILRSDGGSVWLELNVTSVMDLQKPVGRLIVARDITERKRAEEALWESEQRMRAILAGALDAVVGMDVQGIVTYWNPRSEEIFGWTRSEAVGRKMSDLIIPPQHREAHERGLQHFLATGSGPVLNRRIEITALHRDGTEFPVELAISASKSDDSYRFTAFIEDITARKVAEEALQESEHQMRLFTLATNDSTWNWDMVAGHMTRNGFERAFGYSTEEVVPIIDWWKERLHPGDRERVLSTFQDAVARGSTACSYEYRFRRRDDSYAIISDRAYIVYAGAGKPVRALGAMTDITTRKQAEEALRESEQRLSRLLEDRERISRDLHDNIIQMLYAIGLGLEECQRLCGGKSKPAGGIIRRIISDLNGVIGDVRSYVTWTEPKIASGRQLTAAIERLARTMEGAHLLHFRLEMSPVAAARLIAEEAEHLLYIVREAMSNSLRHSSAHNGLVSLQACDGRVRLRVEDDGVGFDPSATRERGEGLQNIAVRVEKLGGTLEIVSGRGQGFRIVIDIPAEKKHASV